MKALLIGATSAVVLSAAVHHSYAQDIVLEMPSYQLREGFGDWWRAAAEAFAAENPGLSINLIEVPFSDHHNQLTTRLIAGNPPDLAHISARFFYNFADEGLLEPLDDYLASIDWNEEDFIPGQQDMRRDGKIYGQLLLGYSYGLFYNRDMFEEAGIELPTDLDSMLDAAETLTVDRDGDGRPDQFGMVWPTAATTSSYVYLTYLITGMGKDWVDRDGNFIERDDLRTAFAHINRLLEVGATPAGLDSNPARQLFWQGNAAMYIDGSWAVAYKNDAAESVQAAYAVAPLPLADQAAGPSNVLAVPAGLPEERREAALKFVGMISSPEWQQNYATISGNPPARLGSVPDEAYELWPELHIFEDAAAVSQGSFMPRTLETDFNEINQFVVDAITGMVSGQYTAEEAADYVYDQMQTAYF
ncbi:MAG: extracellular solute-binding protein [Mesorhizobium sp.]|nr:extracellular solute-binding protein [Mesorhizobium sp.]